MNELLPLAVIIGILTSAIRLATPYLYAAIGEAFAQTSGVVNLGVDGIMLIGAFAAFYVTLTTGNLWLGLLVAARRRAADGPADVLDQRDAESRAGHQRHRPVHVRAGPVQPAVQGHGRHRQDGHRLSTGRTSRSWAISPCSGRSSSTTACWCMARSCWCPWPGGCWRRPPGAEDQGRRAKPGRRRFAGRQRGPHPLSQRLHRGRAGRHGRRFAFHFSVNLFQDNLTAGLGFIAVALVYFGGWRPVGSWAGPCSSASSTVPAVDAGAGGQDPPASR